MKKNLILLIITLVPAVALFGAGSFKLPAGIGRTINISTPTSWTGAGNNSSKSSIPAIQTATPVQQAVLGTAGAAVVAATVTTFTSTPAAVTTNAAASDEGQEAYDSVTNTADFNYRPAFVESKYEKNELFRDVAVSAVEAVPFGFLLTFAGIFIAEAAGQGTFQPQLKTLKDYTPVYEISIGAFAALNIAVNTLFFYDYKDSHDSKR